MLYQKRYSVCWKEKKLRRLFAFWVRNAIYLSIYRNIVYCARISLGLRQMWSIFRIKRLKRFQILQYGCNMSLVWKLHLAPMNSVNFHFTPLSSFLYSVRHNSSAQMENYLWCKPKPRDKYTPRAIKLLVLFIAMNVCVCARARVWWQSSFAFFAKVWMTSRKNRTSNLFNRVWLLLCTPCGDRERKRERDSAIVAGLPALPCSHQRRENSLLIDGISRSEPVRVSRLTSWKAKRWKMMVERIGLRLDAPNYSSRLAKLPIAASRDGHCA